MDFPSARSLAGSDISRNTSFRSVGVICSASVPESARARVIKFSMDTNDCFLVLAFGSRLPQRNFSPGAHQSNRRPQLVRSISSKLRYPLERTLQPAEHLVQGFRKTLKFVSRLQDWQAFRQFMLTDRLCRPCDFPYWSYRLPA